MEENSFSIETILKTTLIGLIDMLDGNFDPDDDYEDEDDEEAEDAKKR